MHRPSSVHLNAASSPKHLTRSVPLMSSFPILSILLAVKETLTMLIPADSSSDSSPGLTTVLHTFPFTPAHTLRSHIQLDTFLHLFQPACTHFSPSSCQTDVKTEPSGTLGSLTTVHMWIIQTIGFGCKSVTQFCFVIKSVFKKIYFSNNSRLNSGAPVY